jgi:hypothetical protein
MSQHFSRFSSFRVAWPTRWISTVPVHFAATTAALPLAAAAGAVIAKPGLDPMAHPGA